MSAARIGGWWQLSLPPAGLQRLRGGAGALSPPGSKDAGTDALEQAERVMSAAKESMRRKTSPSGGSLADQRRAGTDAHEKQRRALLADAYSRASQDQGEEEEEEMEDVMDDLEELARAMAQFKELSMQQQQRIDRGNKMLDKVMDTVTDNIPGMTKARKHVEGIVSDLRATNRSHFRRQFIMAGILLVGVYLSMKL